MEPNPSLQPSEDNSSQAQKPYTSGDMGNSTFKKIFSGKPIAVVFILVFAAIGSYLLFHSSADASILTKTWATNADWTTNSTLSHVTIANNSVTLAAAPTSTKSTTSVPVTASTNLALKRPAIASSIESWSHPAASAVDGNTKTRWASVSYKDPQWMYVDLGATYNISEVKLVWERAYAKAYQIQTSTDAKNWTNVYSTTTGTGGTNDLTSLKGTGRYVRMYGTVRGTQWGYSLYDFQVYGTNGQVGTTPTPPTTTAYSTPGTLTLNFDADAGTTSTSAVDWTTAVAQQTTPTGTTIGYQYATSSDNKTWSALNSDVTKIANSRYVKVLVTLSTTNTTVTPMLNSLKLSYSVASSVPTPALPTAKLSASPSTVSSGTASTLTWSSTNSTSCTASGSWSGTKATSGTASTGAITASGTYNLKCTGTGSSATATAAVTVSTPVTTTSSPSGQAMPGSISGYKQVCGEDFNVNAPTGTFGTSDAGKVVYTGGCPWTSYPDTWPATYTNGQPGYEPSKVLSVHNGVLDYNLAPINGHAQGANISPLLGGTGSPYQTYGKYIMRIKIDKVAGYHNALLLWPTDDSQYQFSESDFLEGDNDSTTANAFAHYGGNGAQAAFSKNLDMTQWHTYEQDWTPTSRSYYIDGQLLGTTTQALWSQPERLQLQVEPSGTAAGGTGHEQFDWVAVYAPTK